MSFSIDISSTSQLIKQTLSPIVHHRSIQSQQQQATNPIGSRNNNLFSLTSNDTTSNASTMNKTLSSSSPSRSLSTHTNTLPASIGRSNNIHYQTESNNYSLKPKTKNFTSPRISQLNTEISDFDTDYNKINSVTRNNSFFNALNSISSSNTAITTMNTNQISSTGMTIVTSANITNNSIACNNIYGTLPKISNPLSGSNATAAGIYGNVSAVANEFEQLIARNAVTCNNTSGGSNYNTLGSYRVQYSSTNPFLPSFNPQTNDTISLNSDHNRFNDEN